jgi:mannose-6-phosphate isomerase-like protein (cupin superfamily)
MVKSFALAMLVLASSPVLAQDKKAPIRANTVKLDNERVRVSESVFKAGDMNPMVHRGYRVTRVLKGSTTIERTSKDGKAEKFSVKEGDVYVTPAGTQSSKNIGKSEIVIYTVVLKPE